MRSVRRSKVFDAMSLWIAVEPVAIAMCDTAVRDGDAVTFCTATALLRLSRARPPSRGSTPSLLAAFFQGRLAQPDLGRCHLQHRDQRLAVGAQLVGVEIAQVGDLDAHLQSLDGSTRRGA